MAEFVQLNRLQARESGVIDAFPPYGALPLDQRPLKLRLEDHTRGSLLGPKLHDVGLEHLEQRVDAD